MGYVKKLLLLVMLSGVIITAGCTKLQTSNASACVIPFDYGDEGVNAQNARALLVHYCLCKDARACD